VVAADIVQPHRSIGRRPLDLRSPKRQQYRFPSRNKIQIQVMGNEIVSNFVNFSCGLSIDVASGYECVASNDEIKQITAITGLDRP
jgi:hypothetical protein